MDLDRVRPPRRPLAGGTHPSDRRQLTRSFHVNTGEVGGAGDGARRAPFPRLRSCSGSAHTDGRSAGRGRGSTSAIHPAAGSGATQRHAQLNRDRGRVTGRQARPRRLGSGFRKETLRVTTSGAGQGGGLFRAKSARRRSEPTASGTSSSGRPRRVSSWFSPPRSRLRTFEFGNPSRGDDDPRCRQVVRRVGGPARPSLVG